MLYQVTQDRCSFLFWTKQEAEKYITACGPAMGGIISTVHILGTRPLYDPWKPIESAPRDGSHIQLYRMDMFNLLGIILLRGSGV